MEEFGGVVPTLCGRSSPSRTSAVWTAAAPLLCRHLWVEYDGQRHRFTWTLHSLSAYPPPTLIPPYSLKNTPLMHLLSLSPPPHPPFWNPDRTKMAAQLPKRSNTLFILIIISRTFRMASHSPVSWVWVVVKQNPNTRIISSPWSAPTKLARFSRRNWGA